MRRPDLSIAIGVGAARRRFAWRELPVVDRFSEVAVAVDGVCNSDLVGWLGPILLEFEVGEEQLSAEQFNVFAISLMCVSG